MAGIRGWLRRLSRRSAATSVTVTQVDGSTKTFAAEPFWLGLFVAQTEAACGVVPEGPVPDALRNATPQDWGRIEALAASGARATSCAALWTVGNCWKWPTTCRTSPSRPKRS